jgi:hypothetical protein
MIGDGLYVRRPRERAGRAIESLFEPRGPGVFLPIHNKIHDTQVGEVLRWESESTGEATGSGPGLRSRSPIGPK